jgi:histidinol dehydrogenase
MRVVKFGDKSEVLRVVERPEIELETAFEAARKIVGDVKSRGDFAVIELTKKFDKQEITAGTIRVSSSEIASAKERLKPELAMALKQAYLNIWKFHSKQYKELSKGCNVETEKGIRITEKTVPLESVGAYIPGGRASYPSTVLMTCAPAKAAGVKRVVVVSPPPISDAILAACDICGVDEVYCVGGAQAVAALAYGTSSIKKVDKIVGPGNKFVQAAKMLVYGKVDIDMPAGPSEVLIIADKNANPKFVAADLLAQAEHDPDARCVLVTDSEAKIIEVEDEIELQLREAKRKTIINESLRNSVAVLVKNTSEAIEFANEYAPEHLEIQTENPMKTAAKIRNAGTIFIGEYSPVSAGDYATGANHVLPTGKAAKFSSELSTRDFIRNYTIQEISKNGLKKISEAIQALAEAESFDAHATSVKKRFK